MKLYLPQK